MRSDRLLRGMHQVCSHDLPNQLVALQSLLEMLHLEESSRLSADGREYVQRLKSAAQKTAELARFLKEMERLARLVARPEEISLPVLGRELQGMLSQSFPHKQFTFDWHWAVPSMVGDYRTIMQAFSEILTWSAGRQGAYCQVQGQAVHDRRVCLQFKLRTLDPAGSARPSAGAAEPGPEKRMEMILAREYLAISQGTLEYARSGDGGDQFTILVPNP